MLLTLKKGTPKSKVDQVTKKIKDLGFKPHISKGARNTIIGVIGENAFQFRDSFEGFSYIETITQISNPFKLVSREFHQKDSVIKINKNISIGGNKVIVMAGPCSVETKSILQKTAKSIKQSGAKILRGGAFKPRTSPYSFQGLGEIALKYLKEVGSPLNMPIVTEAMTIEQADIVARYADIIQVGARNIQNFDLLKYLGTLKKPILLKRGMSTTIKEFLMSAEYIASQGNYNIILCERGIRTFETATRFTLDLSSIPVIKKLSHLPVIVDPSHGTGVKEYITPMALAAVAAGCDGLMIEVHANPSKALCDGPQALLPKQFDSLMKQLKPVANAVGRKI